MSYTTSTYTNYYKRCKQTSDSLLYRQSPSLHRYERISTSKFNKWLSTLQTMSYTTPTCTENNKRFQQTRDSLLYRQCPTIHRNARIITSDVNRLAIVYFIDNVLHYTDMYELLQAMVYFTDNVLQYSDMQGLLQAFWQTRYSLVYRQGTRPHC